MVEYAIMSEVENFFNQRITRRTGLALAGASALSVLPTNKGLVSADGNCQFKLGFKTLHDAIPAQVGSCVDNEQYAANGDSIQHTTGGEMVWRKGDNFTAFTDGSSSWVAGPTGVQERPNNKRFPWEANPDNLPVVQTAVAESSSWQMPPRLTSMPRFSYYHDLDVLAAIMEKWAVAHKSRTGEDRKDSIMGAISTMKQVSPQNKPALGICDGMANHLHSDGYVIETGYSITNHMQPEPYGDQSVVNYYGKNFSVDEIHAIMGFMHYGDQPRVELMDDGRVIPVSQRSGVPAYLDTILKRYQTSFPVINRTQVPGQVWSTPANRIDIQETRQSDGSRLVQVGIQYPNYVEYPNLPEYSSLDFSYRLYGDNRDFIPFSQKRIADIWAPHWSTPGVIANIDNIKALNDGSLIRWQDQYQIVGENGPMGTTGIRTVYEMARLVAPR